MEKIKPKLQRKLLKLIAVVVSGFVSVIYLSLWFPKVSVASRWDTRSFCEKLTASVPMIKLLPNLHMMDYSSRKSTFCFKSWKGLLQFLTSGGELCLSGKFVSTWAVKVNRILIFSESCEMEWWSDLDCLFHVYLCCNINHPPQVCWHRTPIGSPIEKKLIW